MSESFETSVPWNQVLGMCHDVKQVIAREAAAQGVQGKPFVSCRVTQIYETGCACYFYFGFIFKGLEDPVGVFEHVEHMAREEILRHGGSVSHHHGIGKIRAEYMERTISAPGMAMLKAVKKELDPKNIFANGNL